MTLPVPNATASRHGVRIPVVVSSRHVHLTAAVIEQLFCDRYQLHNNSTLSQAKLYAAAERVSLIGPNGKRLSDVLVVAPPHPANQVEISRTDAQFLGLRVPTRDSGDLMGTPGVIIEGPRTSVTLGTGVICPQRHLHVSPANAARMGLEDGSLVELSTDRPHRGMLFRDVRVRVGRMYQLELHLDNDEANAAGLHDGDTALLMLPTPLSAPVEGPIKGEGHVG